jgi:AraC-like DNA-binding protein
MAGGFGARVAIGLLKAAGSDGCRTMKNLSNMQDMMRLRATLEAFAVGRWMDTKGWDSIVESIRSTMARLREFAVQGDYSAFLDGDKAFHRVLVESAHMPELLFCWEHVTASLSEWIGEIHREYWPNLMDLFREHEYVLDAIVAGRPDQAEQAVRRHVEAGWDRMHLRLVGRMPADIDPVDRAVAFMTTHYGSRIDVRWIARQVCHVSVVHLSRLFKAKMSVTPHEYLIRIRMEKAARLLDSGSMPVADVARLVGYTRPSYFVRAFKTRFNITPGAYRTKIRRRRQR